MAGGLLAAIDWRAVFWINVPVGVFGTLWAYLRLRETGERHRARIDWWGNVTFAVGLGAILVGITAGIQPYHGHSMGWANPTVIGLLAGGLVLLIAFGVIESRIAEPMFQLSLFRIRAFTAAPAWSWPLPEVVSRHDYLFLTEPAVVSRGRGGGGDAGRGRAGRTGRRRRRSR